MFSAFVGVAGALILGLMGIALPIMGYKQKVDIVALLLIVICSASLFHSSYTLVQWGLG